MEKKVFISSSFDDAGYARKLADQLRGIGVKVFMVGDPILMGESWEQRIRKELEISSVFVPVLSASWNQSEKAAMEYGAAYISGKKIVPVLIEDIEGKPTIDLSRFFSVDGKNDNIESVAHQVEEALT